MQTQTKTQHERQAPPTTVAPSELSPAQKLDNILDRFQNRYPTEGANLRALLNTTPELKSRMTEAVGLGHLEKIEPISEVERIFGVVGAYLPKDNLLQVPLDYLLDANKDSEFANNLRVTLGHEIEHAINKIPLREALDKLATDAWAVATGPSPHDYTGIATTHIDGLRQREAHDEIAGVNVLASHIQRENPDATQAQLYEKLYNATTGVQSYFDVQGTPPNQTYQPKEGIVFGENFQIPQTPENVEAFAKHFFDSQRYRQITGEGLIEYFGKVEDKAQSEARAANPNYVAPEVRIDLQTLGVKDVELPPGFVDTSAQPTQPQPQRNEPATESNSQRVAPAETGAVATGDRYLDALLAAVAQPQPQSLQTALGELAQSPDGQRFRHEGHAQHAESESLRQQQLLAERQTQPDPVVAEARVSHGFGR